MAKMKPAPKLVEPKQEELIGLIQGITPGSKNEWYVALALDKLQIDYIYQYSLSGGRGTRGGQMIDFVVYNPMATPVYVQGEYWHNEKTENEDILKQADAENYFKQTPILLYGDETDTKDKAYQTVMEKIGA